MTALPGGRAWKRVAQLRPGERWLWGGLTAVGRGEVPVPSPTGWTHVQFRRFAGCPICSLHLRQFTRRRADLADHGVTEIIVFASSETTLAHYADEIPFALVADEHRLLYRKVGLERAGAALLHPRVWRAGLRGLFASRVALPERWADAGGVPADFLLDTRGVIQACRYGLHADDQWSVEEVFQQIDRLLAARGVVNAAGDGLPRSD